MITPGLVSVTFRQKTPLEICRLCEKSGLRAIEWGADVHASPHSPHLSRIRAMSRDYGLCVCSYGSYYRVTQPIDELRACLDAACELGTDTVRIWCGVKGSREAEAEREKIIDALSECALEARARSLTLALEYHGGTLTDSRESVSRLMQETAALSDCLSFYWQPRFDWTLAERLASLMDILTRLAHLHVFTWSVREGRIMRLPLARDEEMWTQVFSRVPRPRHALLEFVENDSEEALRRDALTLLSWLNV